MFVEPGVKTGLPVLIDNPSEAGADRICNCVAAFDRFAGPCIVVDMGTATTFDVVSARGEFLGGAIAPGLGISADALFTRAACPASRSASPPRSSAPAPSTTSRSASTTATSASSTASSPA